MPRLSSTPRSTCAAPIAQIQACAGRERRECFVRDPARTALLQRHGSVHTTAGLRAPSHDVARGSRPVRGTQSPHRMRRIGRWPLRHSSGRARRTSRAAAIGVKHPRSARLDRAQTCVRARTRISPATCRALALRGGCRAKWWGSALRRRAAWGGVRAGLGWVASVWSGGGVFRLSRWLSGVGGAW